MTRIMRSYITVTILFCFSLKLTSNLMTNGYTDIQGSRVPIGQNWGDMKFPLTEDFPMIHACLYSIGVTRRSMPITLLVGWLVLQQNVNSRHCNWHQHLCNMTHCDGL